MLTKKGRRKRFHFFMQQFNILFSFAKRLKSGVCCATIEIVGYSSIYVIATKQHSTVNRIHSTSAEHKEREAEKTSRENPLCYKTMQSVPATSTCCEKLKEKWNCLLLLVCWFGRFVYMFFSSLTFARIQLFMLEIPVWLHGIDGQFYMYTFSILFAYKLL